MSQFNVTTTGTVGTVVIEDLQLTLTHPQTIDLRNDALEKFSWAEIIESDDLQTAIDVGEINATDDLGNPITAITLDHLSNAITQAVLGSVQDSITDGVTTIAPSQNAVFDALSLKLDAAGITAFASTLLDDPDATTMRATLGLGTAAVADSTDFATAAQGITADSAIQPGDNISELTNDSGYVDAVGATLAAPIQSVFGRTTSAILAVASDYDDSQIDFTYTPINFTATNAFVSGALEGIDNAIGAISLDGNDVPVVRGNTITNVAPTAGEVPSPIVGDTASIFLSDGTLEKWVFTGTWGLAYTLTANQATNLTYVPSALNGTITSSTGADATIPLAGGTNAGLLSPTGFNKLEFITITQPIDLDALETLVNTNVTGISINSGDIAALQAKVYGTEFNLFQSLPVATTTSTAFQSAISGSTTNLPVGDYKVLISYSWNHNSTQNDFEARFLFDGVAIGQNTTGLIHKAEPKDAAGNFSGTGTNQQYTFTQSYYVSVTAGVKTVALDYRTSTNGNASSIWDASIEVIRVR